MTLREFALLLSTHISDFEVYWTEQAMVNSAVFPAEMDDADWMDQFLAFLEVAVQ